MPHCLSPPLVAGVDSSLEGSPSNPGKIRLTQHGLHFFDRQSGLNALLDEVKAPEHLWAKAPRYVSVALTNACELRCSYCYAPKHHASLGHEQVLRWARELDEAGCLGLGFGGGEPTLHREFVGICHSVAEQTQLAVTFTTHGHRMTPQLAERLHGAVHFIRVSVDGIGTTYERLRGRPFSELQAAVDQVASVAPFGINVVVNDDTIDELDQVAAFAQRVGASELLLLPEQPTLKTRGLGRIGRECLTKWIRARSLPLRLAMSRSGLEGAVPIADPFPGEATLDAHAHVSADGVLRPDAYSDLGIEIESSILEAHKQLKGLQL